MSQEICSHAPQKSGRARNGNATEGTTIVGDDFATIALTRKTWAGVFLGQLNYLYSLVLERNQWEEGSDQRDYYQRTLREAIDTYIPVLKEASMVDPNIDKEWFEFKIIAGMFPQDSLVDNAKQIVHITAG